MTAGSVSAAGSTAAAGAVVGAPSSWASRGRLEKRTSGRSKIGFDFIVGGEAANRDLECRDWIFYESEDRTTP